MRPLTPSRAVALHTLNNFVQAGKSGLAYAADRNTDRGPQKHHAVSCLSAPLRHRLLTETEVLAAVLAKEGPSRAEKFIQEVCWRTYWKGWLEHRPQVWAQYKQSRDNQRALNPAVLKAIDKAKAGHTGIECFDAWTRELVETGYLHNHARMWFASIWIFTLNLPWAQGADWFMQHLLDADAASNTLSWRWVAGLQTQGKHYLARADNIARYTGGRFDPRGQLNEDAEASVGTVDHDGGVASGDNNSAAANFARYKAPVLTGKEILLLHEDDCCMESFDPIQSISGMVVVRTTGARSANSIGDLSREFTHAALQDASDRAAAKWQIPPDQILMVDDAAQLFDRYHSHWAYRQQSLIHAWLPVGPSRDALAPALQRLSAAQVNVQPILRDWDRQAWPYATRGFFQFKTKIPSLLQDQFSPELF